jgi:hypothetical protein
MSISNSREYIPRTFRSGEFAAGLSEMLAALSAEQESIDLSFYLDLPDGSTRKVKNSTLRDLDTICDPSNQAFRLEIHFKDTSGGSVYLALQSARDELRVHASCDDGVKLQGVFASITDRLKLTEKTKPTHKKGKPSDSTITSWHYFVPKKFQAGEFARALRDAIQVCFSDDERVHFRLCHQLPDGSSESIRNLTYNDLGQICELGIQGQEIQGIIGIPQEDHTYFSLSHCKGILQLQVSSSLAELTRRIVDSIVKHLTLEKAKEPSDSAEFDTRLRAIEAFIERSSGKLRCFLSYRFGNSQAELDARKVEQFLTLLDVEVVTAEAYEPRRISDKVLERMNQSLDFEVLLVPSEGESSWLRDEVNEARTKGLHVIPLVHEAAKFGPGLLGDIEYVKYSDGHIGDAMLSLLQALHFIRVQRPKTPTSLP